MGNELGSQQAIFINDTTSADITSIYYNALGPSPSLTVALIQSTWLNQSQSVVLLAIL